MAPVAKIMILDDSAIVLEAARQQLTAAGYEVVTRSSPIGTTVAVRKARPDVVLVDITMPALDGDKVVPLLRAAALEKKPAILLFSDHEASEVKRLAAACGADGFVLKSEGPAALLREVRRVVESPPL